MTRATGDLDVAVRRLVGDPAQLVHVERLVRDDGPGRGAPVLLVRNPRGLSFEVLLDRAMDVGWADAPGLPLAWRSARGPVASQRYEPQGTGWTRTFGGGLLSTCGLASTGTPSTVDGVHHPLHGRVGHTPAEHVRWRTVTLDGVPAVEIRGEVVEADLGVPPLRLRRRLLARTDRPELCIEDVVTNEGFAPAAHMFRHHLNLGYPLVRPGTVVSATATPVGTRDGGQTPTLPWMLDLAADGAGDETVLYCRPAPGPTATVTVSAPDGTCVEVEQDTHGWPLLVLWRDPRPGTNVLGVEPSTSRDAGRAQAERDGEVRVLPPGGEVHYRTVVRVLA
ncbi:MAG: DUF4432 family protein [Cellulomonas sp.]|uniref:DUF4432 family protein n=1 Tax=Cellulomonas sp. TaxID=40001 RepID=UPI0019DEFAD1|nr:DUF4432 family protein [Cellulomonas sp.]MBF0687402.1 DUF4432 family protein [Cellulomonas sp.]